MAFSGKIKRPVVDLLYSFTAYALPTFALQFLILPFIAGQLTAEKNGLFLALFNAVRLCVSLFIIPLSNIRLLKKKECLAEPSGEKGFNFLFLLVTALSSLIVMVLGLFYYGWIFDFSAMLRLIAVLLLIAAHDYFSIAFRINLTYRFILIDNVLIVLGYLLGIGLMWKLGHWELIFICGYAFGLAYTMFKSNLWRRGVKADVNKETVSKYCQLSVSSGLNNATTYCDKMLIYPLIGGYSVSVYNAAAAVSKLMSLISVPLRNVFLSYIVDRDAIFLPGEKRKKLLGIVLGGTAFLYGGFYLASLLLCRLLYPQYFAAAIGYIPIILLAILFETYAGLLKVYLLRFENTVLQVVTSCVKIVLYLFGVLMLNVVFDCGLMGFCLSILLADSVHFLIVLFFFAKNVKNKREDAKHVS
ncbi:MAG: hypothetical protein E7655_02225 [Ruminococcaceae bacterium]|nr:hypothetical protein [Oscillospiraceae bacterium]